jgi:hypothetical protein
MKIGEHEQSSNQVTSLLRNVLSISGSDQEISNHAYVLTQIFANFLYPQVILLHILTNV